MSNTERCCQERTTRSVGAYVSDTQLLINIFGRDREEWYGEKMSWTCLRHEDVMLIEGEAAGDDSSSAFSRQVFWLESDWPMRMRVSRLLCPRRTKRCVCCLDSALSCRALLTFETYCDPEPESQNCW